MTPAQIRKYRRGDVVSFRKTGEAFGGLSNMAPGYPIMLNGLRVRTAEALYQACRFPHLPEVQELILGEISPMTAKMRSKPHRGDSRPDWDRVRVPIMKWCLRAKLASNWASFSDLLLQTGERPIVEDSRKDEFWGAKPGSDDCLIGQNVLGRLLMELREKLRTAPETIQIVEPVPIPDFLLLSEPIRAIARPSTSHPIPPHNRTDRRVEQTAYI
jgi:ribA/ribD-fused uncharacterized protein